MQPQRRPYPDHSRKPLPPDRKRSQKLSVLFTPGERAALEQAALTAGTVPGIYLRRVVASHLAALGAAVRTD